MGLGLGLGLVLRLGLGLGLGLGLEPGAAVESTAIGRRRWSGAKLERLHSMRPGGGRINASEAGHAARDPARKRPPAAPPATYYGMRPLAYGAERFDGRNIHDGRQQIQLIVSQHVQYLDSGVRCGRPLRERVAALSRNPAPHRDGIHRRALLRYSRLCQDGARNMLAEVLGATRYSAGQGTRSWHEICLAVCQDSASTALSASPSVSTPEL